MFDLNAAVNQWLADVVSAEPSLRPHVDELADHLISEGEARIHAGATPAAAFAAATEALGHMPDLAEEFRKDGTVLSHLYRMAGTERQTDRREQLAVSAAWIVLSLIWAGVMLVIENSTTWAIIAWTVTTYLPLSFISLYLNRRKPKPSFR